MFDSSGVKIKEERSDNFVLNATTPSQSRNYHCLENKNSERNITYTKALHEKNNSNMRKYRLDADAVSEYSAGTPTLMTGKQELITKSLNTCKQMLQTSKKLKEGMHTQKYKILHSKYLSQPFVSKSSNKL